jgi:hypothetical protein
MHFAEPEPDFESMLNLSPQDSPVDLPMDEGPSPVSNLSNPDSYQSLGWSPQPAPNPTVQSLLQPPIFDTALASRPPDGPPRPKITRLVPMEGPTHGGIEVTVLGENFYPGMVCAFGAFQALTVQTYGPTTIVCVLPPSPNPGPVPVHVLDPNGQPQPWNQPPICFTYQDATDRKLYVLLPVDRSTKLTMLNAQDGNGTYSCRAESHWQSCRCSGDCSTNHVRTWRRT